MQARQGVRGFSTGAYKTYVSKKNAAQQSIYRLLRNPSRRRRYEQDKKGAALLQGVYIDVHDQNKTQARRSIAMYIRRLLYFFIICLSSAINDDKSLNER